MYTVVMRILLIETHVEIYKILTLYSYTLQSLYATVSSTSFFALKLAYQQCMYIIIRVIKALKCSHTSPRGCTAPHE